MGLNIFLYRNISRQDSKRTLIFQHAGATEARQEPWATGLTALEKVGRTGGWRGGFSRNFVTSSATGLILPAEDCLKFLDHRPHFRHCLC